MLFTGEGRGAWLSVAAVDRGKQVIVGRNQTVAVADHDFTKLTIIPSVMFFVDIPENIEGSFYTGQVYMEGLYMYAMECDKR